MANFDYVTDEHFQRMLLGDLRDETCEAALDVATAAYNRDSYNELVSFERQHLHAAALDAAEAFQQRHYGPGVLANLKLFWSV